METKQKSGIVRHINQAVKVINRIGSAKNKLNQKMEGKYSPSLIAMVAAAAAALLMLLMLFVPNYLGVADDGSAFKVMDAAGIFYIQDRDADIYNNYFVRVYSNVLSLYQYRGSYMNSQVLMVRAAVFLDDLITRDRFFDIRFLALLYGILYVPAVYLVIKQACMRVKTFSEGVAIGLVGVVIFADVAYITYFNSFYPESVWFISFLYLLGTALSFQENRKMSVDMIYLFLFVAAALILITSRRQCALLGLLLAIFCVKLLFVRGDWKWGVACILGALFLSFVSITCMVRMESDFDDNSKFHAMTRGVLFGSDDPAKTLEEFEIAPSYELLADVSSYEELPLVLADDPVLRADFLDKYNSVDIGMYYIKHPGKFLSMMDIAIKACFGIRRDYCGNYEKSVGLPGTARSLFWGIWSTFKNSSAPKTIGFLVVLAAAAVLLYRKGYSLRPEEDRKNVIFLDMMMVLVLVCVVQSGVAIIGSGDAEMASHCFPVSVAMDLMTYYIFAELVNRINIF